MCMSPLNPPPLSLPRHRTFNDVVKEVEAGVAVQKVWAEAERAIKELEAEVEAARKEVGRERARAEYAEEMVGTAYFQLAETRQELRPERNEVEMERARAQRAAESFSEAWLVVEGVQQKMLGAWDALRESQVSSEAEILRLK